VEQDIKNSCPRSTDFAAQAASLLILQHKLLHRKGCGIFISASCMYLSAFDVLFPHCRIGQSLYIYIWAYAAPMTMNLWYTGTQWNEVLVRYMYILCVKKHVLHLILSSSHVSEWNYTKFSDFRCIKTWVRMQQILWSEFLYLLPYNFETEIFFPSPRQ
jgi:hypothetical protein